MPERAPARTRSLRGKLALGATALLGLLVTLLLVSHVGARSLWERLQSVGPGVIWMLGIYLLGTLVVGLPLRWLCPPGARPGVLACFVSRLVASALNVVVPGLGIVGEPSRLLWLERTSSAAGVAALVVDRGLFGLASLALLAVSVAAAVALPRLSEEQHTVALVLGGLLGAVTLLLVWAAAALGRGTVKRWAGRGERLVLSLRRRLGLLAGAAGGAGVDLGEPSFSHQLDLALGELLGRPPSQIFGLGATFLLGRLLLAGEVVVGLWAVGSDASGEAAFLLAMLPVLVSLFGSLVPGQLGIQEAAQVVVCRWVGVDPAAGLLVVLLQRARQLILVPMAALLLAARLRRRRGLKQAGAPAAGG